MLDRKRRVHQCLTVLTLLVIVPGALLGIFIITCAVSSGVRSGFELTDFIAIILCAIPMLLAYWGIKIFYRLSTGYLPAVRKSLLQYLVVVALYCGIWLASTSTRGGETEIMFSPQEQGIGIILLMIPLLSVLLTNPDKPEEQSPSEE